jgi:hypothetical protein
MKLIPNVISVCYSFSIILGIISCKNSDTGQQIKIDSEAIYQAVLKKKAVEMLLNADSIQQHNNKVYAVFWVDYLCEYSDLMKRPVLQSEARFKYSDVVEFDNWNEDVKNEYLDQNFSTINCPNDYKQDHHDEGITRHCNTFHNYTEASEWRYKYLVQKASQE